MVHLQPAMMVPQYNGQHQAPTYFLCDDNAMQVPTVLQPPYQSCSGPTSSNDGGLYGPYWPDGKFVPYRPAATRHIAYHNTRQSEQSRRKSPPFLYGDHKKSQQNEIISHNADTFDHRQGRPGLGKAPDTSTEFVTGKPQFVGQQQPAFLETGSLSYLRQRGMYNLTLSYNAKNQNGQFKEKALAWAHGVYVELLLYLQLTRRSSQSSKRPPGLGRSYSQASIYPKPPRQSSFSSVLRPSAELYEQPACRLDDVQRAVISNGRRSSLPLTGQMEKKQSSGNSATVENGKHALEMLTNLCRESEWRWIDGMLLGGCLAYGLEDYHKALEWYTKIVSIDPR